jgi:hypothetical protein
MLAPRITTSKGALKGLAAVSGSATLVGSARALTLVKALLETRTAVIGAGLIALSEAVGT